MKSSSRAGARGILKSAPSLAVVIQSSFSWLSGSRKMLSSYVSSIETKIVQMDEIVSEAAMNISENAADKLVSLSVAICGSVQVVGKNTQLMETVSSILRESLKRADSGTVMTVELRVANNMELETGWNSTAQQPSEEKDLLGAGFIRLVASSHGGWLNADMENRRITLILPLAGAN